MKIARKQATTVAITATFTAVCMLLFIERAEQDSSVSASNEEAEDHDTANFIQDKTDSPEELSPDLIPGNPVDDLSSTETESSSIFSSDASNFERSIVNGSAISTDLLADLESTDEAFDYLTAEFRNGASVTGAERRIKYEGMFSAPPQFRNGSVSLDVLECGEVLCVVKYRADNESLLDEYAKNVMTSGDFDAHAIMQLHENPAFSPDISRRLIFSHDPNVSGVNILNGLAHFSDSEDD